MMETRINEFTKQSTILEILKHEQANNNRSEREFHWQTRKNGFDFELRSRIVAASSFSEASNGTGIWDRHFGEWAIAQFCLKRG
jgi:hypothetical protein